MSKKYQKNTDPDSSEEESQTEPLDEPSLNKNLNQTPTPAPATTGPPRNDVPYTPKGYKKSTGRPPGAQNKDPKELIFTQEQINKLIIEKYGPKYKEKIPLKDIKKLVPPKPKYIMTDEDKVRLRQQLERGRETIKKNKELKKQQQLKEVEEMRKKSIIVPNPRYVKKQQKIGGSRTCSVRTEPKTKPLRQEEELYPDDTEESETTDTREIRKTKEKIQLIKATTQAQPQVVKPYSQLSILEKLKSKF